MIEGTDMKLDNNGKEINIKDYEGKIKNITYQYATATDIERDLSIEFDDIHQEVMLSFFDAVDKYDSSKGSFPAFFQLIADNDMKDLIRTVKARYTGSYDVPIGDALLEPAPDTIDNMEREESIKSAVFGTLSERDGNILLEYFGVGVLGDKGLTQAELAPKYGLSREGVTKVIQKALANPDLKTHLQSAFIN
jgi:RNA polymerase sigma factor (sigma-70 family)